MFFASQGISNTSNSNFRFYEHPTGEQISAASLWSAVTDFGMTQPCFTPNFMDPDFRFNLMLNFMQSMPQDFAEFSMDLYDFNKGFTPFGDLPQYISTKTDLAAFKNDYNSELGKRFARIADNNARQMNTSGKCAKGVRTAMEKTGIADGFRVNSAKDADRILNHHNDFKPVGVNYNDLTKLPAGCIIVWEESAGHPHGHIAVTLGNGKEASDKPRTLVRREGVKYSVYMPKIQK